MTMDSVEKKGERELLASRFSGYTKKRSNNLLFMLAIVVLVLFANVILTVNITGIDVFSGPSIISTPSFSQNGNSLTGAVVLDSSLVSNGSQPIQNISNKNISNHFTNTVVSTANEILLAQINFSNTTTTNVSNLSFNLSNNITNQNNSLTGLTIVDFSNTTNLTTNSSANRSTNNTNTTNINSIGSSTTNSTNSSDQQHNTTQQQNTTQTNNTSETTQPQIVSSQDDPLLSTSVDVSSCSTLNTPGAIYNLTTNINSTGDCLTISADNIVLDGRGFVILYATGGSGRGINIDGNDNITIKNIHVRETNTGNGNSHALDISNANGINISNVSILTTGAVTYTNSNDNGISFSSVGNSTIEFTNVTTIAGRSPIGILLSSSNNNTIRHSQVRNTGYENIGIRLTGSSGNYIINNTVTDTNTESVTSDGTIEIITNSNYNFLTDNTVSNTADPTTFTPNNAEEAINHGIYIALSTGMNLSGNNFLTSRGNSISIYGTTNTHYNHTIGNTNNVHSLPVNYTSGISNSNRIFEGIDFNDYGLMMVVFADNVTFKNSNFSGEGIHLYFSENSSIINSTITANNGYGFYSRNSNSLNIQGSTINSNERASYAFNILNSNHIDITNTQLTTSQNFAGSLISRNSSYLKVINVTLRDTASGGNLQVLTLTQNSDYPYFKNVSVSSTSSFNVDTVYLGSTSHGVYEDFSCTASGDLNVGCLTFSATQNNNTFRGGTISTTATTFAVAQPFSLEFNSGTLTNILFQDMVLSTTNFADIVTGNGLGNSVIVFRNVSSDENFTINDAQFVGRWQNYFRANVTTSGLAVANANVTISYNNGSQAYSVLTDANGLTGKLNLTEYNIDSGNGLVYESPYSITITTSSYATDTATLNFSDNYIYNASLLPATPQVTILNPTNGTNVSSGFQAFNASVPGTNIDSVIFMFNTNGTLFNVTATNVSGNWNANINVSTLEEGLQTTTVFANSTSNSVNQSETVTIRVDRTAPIVNMQNSSFNTSDTTPSFTFNYTDAFLTANCTLLVNDDHNTSNPLTTNDTNTILTASTLVDGEYNISISCIDGSGNKGIGNNITVYVDNANPSIVNVSYTPTVSDDVDPETLFTFNATVTDATSGIQTVFLQVFNGTAWTNRSMINQGSGLYQGNFTTYAGDRNYTFSVFASDTINNVNISANQSIIAAWDCSWIYSPVDLGATAGFSSAKTLGNIYINNTGDPQFSDTNCSLDFRLSYSLTSGRILFDGDSLKPSSTYTVAAGANQTIEVNATFLAEQREDSETISITEVRGRSNKSAANVSATIISSQGGAYLFNTIDSYPTTVYLTDTPFTLGGYVRNLVGNGSVQTAANNVSFNWSLPGGFTVSDGVAAVLYNYIDNSTAQYNNINITFTSVDLASLSPGFVTVAITAQGKNSSGEFITHVSDNQIVTSSVQVLLACYNVSDGIEVPQCGSLDGDYVESTTTTTTTTSSSGGGGGGGGGGSLISTGGSTAEQRQRLFQTEDSYELLRGRQEVFILKMENPFRYPLEDVSISINGFLAQYLSVSPSNIDRIEANNTQIFEIAVQAPEYFTRGKHNLQFIIDGTIVGPGLLRTAMQETRDVTLVIHEISQEEAREFNAKLETYIAEMVEQGLNVREITGLAEQANSYLSQKEYELVKETHDAIKLRRDQAFQTLSILADLEKGISKSKRNGLEVPETERLLLLVQAALARGDYTTAVQRAEDARTAYVLETAGRFNLFGFIKGNWLAVSIGFIIFIVSSTLIYLFIKDRLISRKLKVLAKEEEVLLGLIKQIQEECFVKRKLSMKEYLDSLMQYEKRMDEIIQETVRQESLKSNLFKFFKGEYERLLEERLRTVQLVKKTQKMYLTAGAIETRIYQNKMKSYTERLSEIEEKIANKEAQMATEKGKGKLSKWRAKALQRAKESVAKQEKDKDILSETKDEVVKEAEEKKNPERPQVESKPQTKKVTSLFSFLRSKKTEKQKSATKIKKGSENSTGKRSTKPKNINLTTIISWVVASLIVIALAIVGYLKRNSLLSLVTITYQSLEHNLSLVLLIIAIIALVVFIVFLARHILLNRKRGKRKEHYGKEAKKLEKIKKKEADRLEQKRKRQAEQEKVRQAKLAKKSALEEKQKVSSKESNSKRSNQESLTKIVEYTTKHATLASTIAVILVFVVMAIIFRKGIVNMLFKLYVLAAVEVISLLAMVTFIAIFYLVVHFFWRPHKSGSIGRLSRSTKKEQEKLFKLELYQHKVKEAAAQGTLNAKKLDMSDKEKNKELKKTTEKKNQGSKKRLFASLFSKSKSKEAKQDSEQQHTKKLEWNSYLHERTFKKELGVATINHTAKKEKQHQKSHHRKKHHKKRSLSLKTRNLLHRLLPLIVIAILLALVALGYVYFKTSIDALLSTLYDTPQKQLIALLVIIVVLAGLITYAVFKLLKVRRRKHSLTQTDLSLELQIGKQHSHNIKHKHKKGHKDKKKQRHKKR